MGQSAITRVITVASGQFAPGHLGELTQQVPFEMVDAVLAETRAVQSRVRDLPSRVVVYLLLAGLQGLRIPPHDRLRHRKVPMLSTPPGLATRTSPGGRVHG